MSEYEWTSFCDKIDETLAPAGPLNRKFVRYMKILIFVVMASIFICFQKVDLSPLVFVIALLVIIGVNKKHLIPALQEFLKVKKKAEQICEEESRKRSNISFHYRVSEKENASKKIMLFFFS